MEMKVGNPQDNTRQKAHTAGVGNETKADMSVVGPSGLASAMGHLKENHASGVKHMPLHGMKPGK